MSRRSMPASSDFAQSGRLSSVPTAADFSRRQSGHGLDNAFTGRRRLAALNGLQQRVAQLWSCLSIQLSDNFTHDCRVVRSEADQILSGRNSTLITGAVIADDGHQRVDDLFGKSIQRFGAALSSQANQFAFRSAVGFLQRLHQSGVESIGCGEFEVGWQACGESVQNRISKRGVCLTKVFHHGGQRCGIGTAAGHMFGNSAGNLFAGIRRHGHDHAVCLFCDLSQSTQIGRSMHGRSGSDGVDQRWVSGIWTDVENRCGRIRYSRHV